MRLKMNEDERKELNLLPMIDVMVNLLIFFLVASKFSNDEREMNAKLEVPEVAAAQPLSMTSKVVVNVERDEGSPDGYARPYMIQGKRYREKELELILIQERQKNPDRSVEIRADGKMPWEYVARVMGLCNKAEIKTYTATAQVREEKAAGGQ